MSRLFLFLISGALFMTAFQLLKHWAFPAMTLWQSHAITITFGALLTTVTAYVVSHRDQLLQRRVLEQIAERERVEEALRTSEERYRSVVENAVEAIVVVQDRVFKYANPQAEELTGFSAEELATKPFIDLIHPDDLQMVLERHLRRLTDVIEYSVYPFRIIDRAGNVKWVEVRATAINWQGEPATLNLLSDITERKRVEEALRESEAQFRALIEEAPLAISISRYGLTIYANPSYLHLFGYESPEALYGHPITEQVAPQWRQMMGRRTLNRELGVPEPTEYESVGLRKDGSQFPYYVAVSRVNLADGPATLAFFTDITERQQAEEKLKHLSRLYAMLSQTNQAIVRIQDRDQLFQAICNVSVEFGHLCMAWVGVLDGVLNQESGTFSPVAYAGHESGYVRFLCENDNTMVPGGPISVALRAGEIVTVDDIGADPHMQPWHEEALKRGYHSCAAVPFRLQGNVVGTLNLYAAEAGFFTEEEQRLLDEISQDISFAIDSIEIEAERQRAEQALRDSEALYRLLAENTNDAVGLMDLNLRTTYLSPSVTRLRGYTLDDMNAIPFDQQMTPDSFNRAMALFAEVMTPENLELPDPRLTSTIDLEFYRKDGSRFWSENTFTLIRDETGLPVNILWSGHDITERKRDEEQIRQQVETLTALYSGAQQLAESLDSLKLADDVVRTCVETFGVRLAWVGRAEADGQVRLLTQFPAEVDYPRQVTVRWDDTPEARGPGGRAIRGGTPVIMNDLQNEPNVSLWLASLRQYGFRSAAVLPLISRHTAFGALMLYSDQLDFFTPERVQFFQSYALQAAAAFENARLFEETERRLSNLQALHRIDVAITSSLDLHLTLDIILDQATVQLQADAASILLFDRQTRALSYAAGRGFRTRAMQETHLGFGEGHASRAVLERRTIVGVTRQSEGDGLRGLRYRAIMSDEGFVAHVATPLIAKGQVVGVLEVFHRATLNTGDEWLAFLETLAGQAAVAIDSATLFNGLQRSNAELLVAYDTTLEGWSRALDLRDQETEGHTRRVADITLQLARAMHLSDAELVHMYRGALLHDIGKMGVSDNILRKPGPLTDEEWVIMRKHPQYAYEMLSPIKYLRPVLDIPYCHHEKWDGTGYPRGLKGEQIPLPARIFAVVDVWDALRTDRPYRTAWPDDRVHEYIRSQAGAHFDPQVVEAFMNLMTTSAGCS
ncbi:MAG: PAS domain S-box protein, partial [Chloroflexi bacterium]|nr:PAS domain S-box protein [Chloroflexota bacterium]